MILVVLLLQQRNFSPFYDYVLVVLQVASRENKFLLKHLGICFVDMTLLLAAPTMLVLLIVATRGT